MTGPYGCCTRRARGFTPLRTIFTLSAEAAVPVRAGTAAAGTPGVMVGVRPAGTAGKPERKQDKGDQARY